MRKELPEDWQRHSGRMVRVKRERWRSLLRPLQHRRVHRVRKYLCGLCFAQHLRYESCIFLSRAHLYHCPGGCRHRTIFALRAHRLVDLGHGRRRLRSIVNLIGMRLRRVVPSKIILPLVKANKAGLDVNVNQLEAHYLAGGDVDRVVDASLPPTGRRCP